MTPGDVVVGILVGAVETKVRPAVVIASSTYLVERPDVLVGILTTYAVRGRLLRLLLLTTFLGVECIPARPGPGAHREGPAAEQERLCSAVTLRFRFLRQPPIYHIGETIQARLSFSANGQGGFTAMPDLRRGAFKQIVIAEPSEGTIDPSALDRRIHIGGGGGWLEGETWERDLDVNEWIQFRRPGRYALHFVVKRGVLMPVPGEAGPGAVRYCDLKSNVESIEILASDAGWEAAELARANKLLESSSADARFRGASTLRYLNTPAAAVALANWYVRLPDEPVKSELSGGIFESGHAEIVRAELEKALRSGTSVPESLVGTLTLLEVRRQFINRPRPSDPKAAQAWSREYWDLLESVKSKYSAEAGRSIR